MFYDKYFRFISTDLLDENLVFLCQFSKVITLCFEQLSERQAGHSFCQINA
jgi:hypothetical protein